MERSAPLRLFEDDVHLLTLYDKLSPEDQRLFGPYGLCVVKGFVDRVVDVLVGGKNG